MFENLKRRYKRALLEKLLLSLENGSPQQSSRTALINCAKPLEDIRSVSLSRAWNKLLICTADNSVDSSESTDNVQSVLDIGSKLSLSSDKAQEWPDIA